MDITTSDTSSYARLLRNYSADDLEDIYQNINILQYPVRYRLLLDEMASRGLDVAQRPVSSAPSDITQWIISRPRLRKHPLLAQQIIAIFLLITSCAVTFGLLAPLWVFAIKWHFLNLPIAMIFFAFLPAAPVVTAGITRRLGSRGWHIVPVLLGILAGLWLFDYTGTLKALLFALTQPACSSGGGFPTSF